MALALEKGSLGQNCCGFVNVFCRQQLLVAKLLRGIFDFHGHGVEGFLEPDVDYVFHQSLEEQLGALLGCYLDVGACIHCVRDLTVLLQLVILKHKCERLEAILEEGFNLDVRTELARDQEDNFSLFDKQLFCVCEDSAKVDVREVG